MDKQAELAQLADCIVGLNAEPEEAEAILQCEPARPAHEYRALLAHLRYFRASPAVMDIVAARASNRSETSSDDADEALYNMIAAIGLIAGRDFRDVYIAASAFAADYLSPRHVAVVCRGVRIFLLGIIAWRA